MSAAERALLYAVGVAVLALLRGADAGSPASRRHGERLDAALRAMEYEAKPLGGRRG